MDLLDYTVDYTDVRYLQWVEAQNGVIRQNQAAVGNYAPMLFDPNHPDALKMFNDKMAEVHRANSPSPIT